MKKIAMFTLAATLSLGSCASIGGTSSATIAADITSIGTTVQAGAAKLCGFFPFLSTAEEMVASFANAGPIADVIIAAEKSICDAVLPLKPALMGGRFGGRLRLGSPMAPVVNGVVIHGRFVQ